MMKTSLAKMNIDRQHIHNVLIFLYHQKKNEKEALASITEIYGEEHLTLSAVKKSYKKFRNGDYSTEDEAWEKNLPSCSKSNKKSKKSPKDDPLYDLIENDPTLTIEELAVETKSTHASVANRVSNLGKIWKFHRWISSKVDDEERGSETGLCFSNICDLKGYRLKMDWITIGDVRWVYYDFSRRQKQNKRKALLSFWWNSKGMVHYEMLKDQSITSDICVDQYEKVTKMLKKKRSFDYITTFLLMSIPQPKIHLDFLRKTLHYKLCSVLTSTDAEPWIFYVYPAIKQNLEGKSFRQIEDLDAELRSFFISQPKSFYSDGIKKLEERWQKVAFSDGVYVED